MENNNREAKMTIHVRADYVFQYKQDTRVGGTSSASECSIEARETRGALMMCCRRRRLLT